MGTLNSVLIHSFLIFSSPITQECVLPSSPQGLSVLDVLLQLLITSASDLPVLSTWQLPELLLVLLSPSPPSFPPELPLGFHVEVSVGVLVGQWRQISGLGV